MNRRRFLGLGFGAAAGLLFAPRQIGAAACAARLVEAVDRERLQAGGITPYDLAKLGDVITPNGDFFVRSHFGAVLVRETRLVVEGRVDRPGTWTLDDLRKLPRREAVITLECAGNSIAQGHGLVSTARWTGCALEDLLRAAGVSSEEDEIVFTGTDAASEGGERYARSMKVRDARAAGALLAWEMNGAPLPIDHGAPLRLVVPGWYGMASVKWLTRIELRSEPFRGRFQRDWYVNRVRSADGSTRIEPVTRVGVKSVVAAVETRGEAVRLRGAAWGGEGKIARVEVTVDGGRGWQPATLEGRAVPGAWRLWRHDWKPPAPGGYVVAARAFDATGTTQPLARPPELAEAPYARNEVFARRLQISC